METEGNRERERESEIFALDIKRHALTYVI